MFEGGKSLEKRKGPSVVAEDLESEVDTVRIRTSKGKEIAFTLRPDKNSMANMDKFLQLKDKFADSGSYVRLWEVMTHDDALRREIKGGNTEPRWTTIFHQAKRWEVSFFEAAKINYMAWEALISMYEKRDRERGSQKIQRS